ncbi:hypothetical protein NE237_022938 [Protea cynaroides]|uniref:AP2/ERF domain-containing protein n=1 Tax=Protea cynaroides TaxID=273540 RepID=A0A9Q0HBX7_9MAGN|nr:hypothetical protein NE237_022938 [Protea cynaroides]
MLKHNFEPQFSLSWPPAGDQVSSIIVSALKHVISGNGGNSAATSSSPIKSSPEFEQAERVPLFLPEADKCGLCEIDGCLGCNLFGTLQPEKKIRKKNNYRNVHRSHWGKWAAEIRGPQSPALGTLDDVGDAAKAYHRATISFHGGRSKINLSVHNSKSQKAVNQLQEQQREEPKSTHPQWPLDIMAAAGPTTINTRDRDFWDMPELDVEELQGWTMMLNIPEDLPTTA